MENGIFWSEIGYQKFRGVPPRPLPGPQYSETQRNQKTCPLNEKLQKVLIPSKQRLTTNKSLPDCNHGLSTK